MFGTKEASRSQGEPVTLYLFEYGDRRTGYTDAEQPIIHDDGDERGPVTYKPIPIQRGKIVSSGSAAKSTLSLTLPVGTVIARLYLSYPPSSTTTVIIRQGHIGDPDEQFLVCWVGWVLSCARTGLTATLTCNPVSSSLKRNGLRRRYQYGCPHALYGPECKASKAAATTSTTVSTTEGNSVTLSPGWSPHPEKHVGGLLEWTTVDGVYEVRTIRRVVNGGATLMLSGPPRGLLSGSTVSAVLGCNHKSGVGAQPDGDCRPLHNNVQNFGGQMYIPFKNPISMVNQFY